MATGLLIVLPLRRCYQSHGLFEEFGLSEDIASDFTQNYGSLSPSSQGSDSKVYEEAPPDPALPTIDSAISTAYQAAFPSLPDNSSRNYLVASSTQCSDKEPGPIGLTTRSEANVASYALFQRSAAASLVSLARNP